ncbi:hypothetical protein GJ744_002592 [Endocarpon pusillum]|uniref:Uncharacterized protein n=1 Tax=Endocarpon pusillum TaxID=364733 RepID=A0A8H7A8M9_9EURO|nr:hypothetical protein GJ744_002592 [Endocarpon pusillum]
MLVPGRVEGVREGGRGAWAELLATFGFAADVVEACLGPVPVEENEEAALVGAVDPDLQDRLDGDGWGEIECEKAESLTVRVDTESLSLSEKAESLTLLKDAEMAAFPDDISILQVSATGGRGRTC